MKDLSILGSWGVTGFYPVFMLVLQGSIVKILLHGTKSTKTYSRANFGPQEGQTDPRTPQNHPNDRKVRFSGFCTSRVLPLLLQSSTSSDSKS